MAIFRPEPRLSAREKRLAQLLINLLEERMDLEKHGNLPKDKVVISQEEKKELLSLLEDYRSSKGFLHRLSFLGFLSPREYDEERARELYLSGRKASGKTRALASMQWAELQIRIYGAYMRITHPYKQWVSHVSGSMSFEYFLKMEEKLFQKFKIMDGTKKYLMKIVTSAESFVEDFRSGDESQKHIDYKELVRTLISEIEKYLKLPDNHELSNGQVACLAIIIANFSVLFTTRDWSAAGVISSVAGSSTRLLTD